MTHKLALVLLALALLTGCSGRTVDSTGTAESATEAAGIGPELVDWFDAFCGVYAWGWAVAVDPPTVPERTGEDEREPLQEFLAAAIDAIAGFEASAADLADPPTASAQAMLEQYRTGLADLRGRFEEHADNAAWFPAGDLVSIYTVSVLEYVAFVPLADETGDGGVFAYVEADPELDAAFRSALECPGGETNESPATD